MRSTRENLGLHLQEGPAAGPSVTSAAISFHTTVRRGPAPSWTASASLASLDLGPSNNSSSSPSDGAAPSVTENGVYSKLLPDDKVMMLGKSLRMAHRPVSDSKEGKSRSKAQNVILPGCHRSDEDEDVVTDNADDENEEEDPYQGPSPHTGEGRRRKTLADCFLEMFYAR